MGNIATRNLNLHTERGGETRQTDQNLCGLQRAITQLR